LGSLAHHHEGTKDTKPDRPNHNRLLLFFFVLFVPFVPSW
jgi:hypothetical protein